MDAKIIGREAEQEVLQEALLSNKAELIAVIGRRRVGKTYLVETCYQNSIAFQIAGIQGASLHVQLRNFTAQLTKFLKKHTEVPIALQEPKDWFAAILQLIELLETIPTQKEKHVVFFDELPWLASPKSGFLPAFSYFWNSWAAKQGIVVVICGSAASWMIKKVVHHRGGLHNRITRRISLKPFTLKETEAYLIHKNIHYERYHIVQLYMTMGGIPHYLEEVKPGLSATQNIEQIAFSATGLLRDEFSKLYQALFTNAERHIAVIRALSTKNQGLPRAEIIKLTGIQEGGSIQKTLEELLESNFISVFRPFGKKKKEKLYRLTDEYSLFYLKFIEGKAYEGEEIWRQISQTQTYKTWTGYAFENICLGHIPIIKKALGISGIYSLSSSFYRKGTQLGKGVQIDLLIDRNDQVITLFEIKFYSDSFSLTKASMESLREKMHAFKQATKTRKQLFWVLISPFGIKNNQYSLGTVAKSLTLVDLFDG